MAERQREHPRMSINPLSKYMVAPPRERRNIIHAQRNPEAWRVAYYADAERAICRHLAGDIDRAELGAVAAVLRNDRARTPHERQRRDACADAIDAMLGFRLDLVEEGLNPSQASARPPQLACAGVQISVRPELVLRSGDGNEEDDTCGFLKLYFGKNDPLNEERARYIGTMVHLFGETHPLRGCRCSRRLCRVIDVFGNRIFEAPASFQRRREDLEAACQEIARAWPFA